MKTKKAPPQGMKGIKSPVLATVWAIVCDQTGLMIRTANQVPFLYTSKIEAEQEIRNSGDRCDVAIEVEIRAVKKVSGQKP